jgi:hypothetical protein
MYQQVWVQYNLLLYHGPVYHAHRNQMCTMHPNFSQGKRSEKGEYRYQKNDAINHLASYKQQ